MSKKDKPKVSIIEVFEDNFIAEIKRIGAFIEEYNFIGMDTEYPGIVHSIPSFCPDFYYKTMILNVEQLKLIQLGITLSNSKGEHPTETSSWQFNLSFDYEKDKCHPTSFTMLTNSGIDFQKMRQKGIRHSVFAEYFVVSGLVLNPHVHWISFHGSYDFAYLLRLLINQPLPESEGEFTKYLIIYFPNHYDIRILVQGKDYLKGGLNRLAQFLEVLRVGKTHQAGSDSVVTADVFFKLIQNNMIDIENIEIDKNIVFGLGKGADDNETITYTPINNCYFNASVLMTNGINGFSNSNSPIYPINNINGTGNVLNPSPGNFAPYYQNSLSIGYPSYFPPSQLQGSAIKKQGSNYVEASLKNMQAENPLLNGTASKKPLTQIGSNVLFPYPNQ